MNLQKAFFVLLIHGVAAKAAAQTINFNIDFGKSYINITKGSNGGTVETGDTLEIRATIAVLNNTSFDSCRFWSVVPAGTTYVPGTVRVLTNEGHIFRQFTDAEGDDAGWMASDNVFINLGFNQSAHPATWSGRGRIASTDRPVFGTDACIMVASFRVRVTAAIGNTIFTGGGNVTYRNQSSASNPVLTHTFPANTVAVYTNFGMCSNSVGINSIGAEFNGSFGAGVAQNRNPSANMPAGYTFANFSQNGPNDYFYGIVNNTSNGDNFSTSNDWPLPDNDWPSHRVFSTWDIIGDHTGAADPYEGNAPGDNTMPSGYMLVINSAYRTDSAFQQTISGLCPNTYYEISCWMRNICSKGSSDSNGINASSNNPAYIPTAPGDSSGVSPNLTFEVDGIEYYTTGNLRYTGKWVKKGFTFLTGPGQTSFTLKLFNNAPGGGGNDWALDDISVATCNPDLTFTPTANPNVCANNTVSIGAIIQSYFNNYTHYKWQRSTNGGASWSETGVSGVGTPTHNGSEWEYNVQYPTFVTAQADSGTKYRVLIATSAASLDAGSCVLSSNTPPVTLHVSECGIVLHTDILSITGIKEDTRIKLQWTATREETPVQYRVERSFDGVRFAAIATIPGNGGATELNTYTFTDGGVSQKGVQYRIRLVGDGRQTVSRIVRFDVENSYTLQTNNPFYSQLQLNFNSQKAEVLHVRLVDMNGRVVRQQQTIAANGPNRIILHNTSALPDGLYTIQIKSLTTIATRRVLKQSSL